jgi:ribosome maturation factor RimP
MVDEERIRSAIAPVLEGLGMTVVRVSWGGQGRKRRLRIDLDKRREGHVPAPYSGSSMTADDLDGATREVSAALDAHAVVEGSYVLEVSTPGLDRSLNTEQDFRDFTGHPVKIVLSTMTGGRRRLQGILDGVEGEGADVRIVVDLGGERVEVALENVQSANLRVVLDGFGQSRRRRDGKRKARNTR